MTLVFSGRLFHPVVLKQAMVIFTIHEQDRVKATIKDTTTTMARTMEAMETDTTKAIMDILAMTILGIIIRIMDMDKAMMITMVRCLNAPINQFFYLCNKLLTC